MQRRTESERYLENGGETKKHLLRVDISYLHDNAVVRGDYLTFINNLRLQYDVSVVLTHHHFKIQPKTKQ